jgi:3-phosphoshikimate 1-carboxyvinyltransferase
LNGRLTVPGDKSISHRYALLAALARGRSRITGLAPGQDVRSTLSCLKTLGARISFAGEQLIEIHGGALQPPDGDLDAGNSGTTMRLFAGVLAGHPFTSRMTGDASLSSRPMERVAEPLRAMGASVATTSGRAPLTISGGTLRAIAYESPVASAQIKSAVLLAGLFAEGRTSVSEPAPTRDHT